MTKAIDNFAIIVPARRASLRLPDKVLADIGGKPMVVRVLERAAAAAPDILLAAVDDDEIAAVIRAAGFNVIITGDCDSGTARVAAASQHLSPDTIIVNMQGDEPFMEPHIPRHTAQLLAQHDDCVCATPMRPIIDQAEFNNPAVVKVVADADGTARYFSRAPIPHQRRGGMPQAWAHLGLYAYRASFLRRFVTMNTAPTEQSECLEQLRILWHGGRIALLECQSQSFAIDTPDDLARARHRAAAD